jgi:hypothetical protein
MTARILATEMEAWQMLILTPSLQVGESAFSACLSADVEEHRTSRLIVRRIEKVPLLECICRVRFISTRIREMIDLQTVSTHEYT